jgi:phage baseplate assembly protein W
VTGTGGATGGGVAFPLRAGVDGRTARTTTERHVADLVEAVLLTAPGERVNRPDFGAGLHRLLFAPVDAAVVATAEMSARSALQRWLGDHLDVASVTIELDDTTVRASVSYTLRTTGAFRTMTVEWSG